MLINFFQYGLYRLGSDDIIPADQLRNAIINSTGEEAYHCAFDLEESQLKVEKGLKTVTKYDGIATPALGYVWFDFDDKENPSNAKADLLALLSAINPPPDSCPIYFSGNKGFHLGVPFSLTGLVSSALLPKILSKVAITLKATYKTLDSGVFNPQRKFRAPGSLNPKSGLYKLRLSELEIGSLNMDEILKAAKFRGNLTIPEPLTLHKSEFMHDLCIKAEKELSQSDTESGGFGFGMENLLDSYTLNTIDEPLKRCAFLKWNFDHPEQVKNEQWIQAINIVSRFVDGSKLCHEMGSKHPEYTVKSTDFEINRAKKLTGATLCKTIRAGGFEGCNHCIEKCNTPAAIRPAKELRASGDSIKQSKQTTRNVKDDDEKVAHLVVVSSVIDSLCGTIIKEGDDLFKWVGTHWKECDGIDNSRIMRELAGKNGPKTRYAEIENLFKLFKLHLPANATGKSLYRPNPFAANFLDGTLYCEKKDGGGFILRFERGHRQSDMLTQCITVNYEGDKQPNKRLGDFIEAILSGDKEYDQKLRALKQCAGAMLMPSFPRIFFLLGEPGSGKSTFSKLFFKLLGGTEFFSIVQPVEMYGFLVETMLHKTVNMHTDVSEKHTVPDSFLKSNEDRLPRLINRKGRKAVEAFTPAVHIFCANTLPPTESKNPRVYDRRVTIVKMDKDLTGSGAGVYDRDYDEMILDSGREAVLEFALEGLRDVVESGGLYFQPPSGKEMTTDWQAMAMDSFDDFIEELTKGELPYFTLTGLDTNTVDNQMFYNAFGFWSATSGHFKNPITKQTFFKRLNILFKSGKLPSLKLGRNNKTRFVSGVVLDQGIFVQDVGR